MDIDQVRTFLAVVNSGSFVAASDHLHITQTAVSARIRTLERELEVRLFDRDKAGVRLTPAGQRFIASATNLLSTWEDARQQLAVLSGRAQLVRLGGEPSLWLPLLGDWMRWMHMQAPGVALRVDVDTADRLIDGVQDGTLDLAIVYGIRQLPTLVVELLVAEKLVMVTSDPGGGWNAESYVHVDWGPAFAANSRAAFPELSRASVATSFGPLAMGYIQSVGGSGYFRASAVQPLLDRRQLFRVADAPEFSHSIFAVHAARTNDEGLSLARAGLRALVANTPGAAAGGGLVHTAPQTSIP